jgi:hypothetical protein
MTLESRVRNLLQGAGPTDDKCLRLGQDGARQRFARTMIRLGHQVRLTRREVERFTKITDIAPVGIRTLAELDAYIARCKAHYWGVSRETQFLHWLIDSEYERCRDAA